MSPKNPHPPSINIWGNDDNDNDGDDDVDDADESWIELKGFSEMSFLHSLVVWFSSSEEDCILTKKWLWQQQQLILI